MLQLKGRGRGMVAEAVGTPGQPLPPKPYLLGLQEVGIPQLADDDLTLLN